VPVLVEALGASNSRAAGGGRAAARLFRAGTIDSTRLVIWLLRSTDVNVRRMAADLARSIKDPSGDVWLKLCSHIRDQDWWVRERIVDALVELGGPQVTRHFVRFLADRSAVIRRFGADVLARLRDTSSISALLQTALADRDWWVAERCVEGVASFGDPPPCRISSRC